MTEKSLRNSFLTSYNEITRISGGLAEFGRWIKLSDKTAKQKKGLSVGYFKTLKTAIEKIPDNFTVSQLTSGEKKDQKKYIYAEKFVEFATEYIKLNNALLNRTDNITFKNWYFYYLEIANDDKDYPKLGRAVLKTNECEATLKAPNANGHERELYQGNFTRINIYNIDKTEPDNFVYFFDLKTAKGTRNLHIKIFFQTGNDEIIIGSYSTFDGRILTGACILERVQNPVVMTPKFLSPHAKSKEFSNVDPAIKEYLAIKRRNYYKVPKTPINSKKILKDFIIRVNSRSDKNIENRFLEMKKPIVFVSSPQTALKDINDSKNRKIDSVERIIQKLRQKLEDQYKVLDEKTLPEDITRMRSLECFKLFERTRHFVLILTKTDMLSFSHVQLGWAIGLCKYIYLIYEEGSISRRIESLDKINQNFRRKKIKDIVLNEEDIFQSILSHILDNQLGRKKNESLIQNRLSD
jgi:hypothetical protein